MKWILPLVLVFLTPRIGTGNDVTQVEIPGGATMAFVWIEPGSFMMGSAESDRTRLSGEDPQHEVTISRGFWLGQCEITQQQWQAVMDDNPSNYLGADRPVERVTWLDVQEFIHRLNQAAGDSLFRLPSEAEWEYASRAGTTTPWFSGDDESVLGDYAWYSANNSAGGDPPVGTKPIATKLPNPWGLYDMLGNVPEWVQDWHGVYLAEAQLDPTGPEAGSSRVFRGGHFYGNTRAVRSAVRGYNGQLGLYNSLGARLLKIQPYATPVSPQSWGEIKASEPGW